ncbi:hypothetical protein PLEOSDRAFT_1112444 [Pleurotus ostreatus PC15]|uniref:Uncharacterized protein n=1 Tax=Pleurotus ostreatus (strain PC15) TaxID=1137138 RepID=A0A067NP44_PLEO1|nr:hypothetical protein PLEOSDRAFT_1112444 [Pleurotus ostreatus PC15]
MATPDNLNTALKDVVRRQGLRGDFFAASQLGGIAGGHRNIKTTINGGEGGGDYESQTCENGCSELYKSFGQLEEMRMTLEGIVQNVDDMIKDLEEKLHVR